MEILAVVEDFFERLLALLVYVGAFAAIPFLAKRFTGALGQLTGMVNDRSKGLFDRTKKKAEGFAEDLKGIQDGRRRDKRRERRSRRGDRSIRRLLMGGSYRKSSGAEKEVKEKKKEVARARQPKTAFGKKLKEARARQSETAFGKKLKEAGEAARRRHAPWRSATDELYAQKYAEPLEKDLQASMTAMSSESFDGLANIVLSRESDVRHKMAALATLGKRGAAGQLERILIEANDPEQSADDYVLQEALAYAHGAGVFSESGVTKKASYMNQVKLVEEIETGPDGETLVVRRVRPPSAASRRRTIGNMAFTALDKINDEGITAFRASVGLDPFPPEDDKGNLLPESPRPIDPTNEAEKAVREHIIEMAKFLLDEKHKDPKTGMSIRDGLSRDKRELFERLLTEEDEFKAEGPPPDKSKPEEEPDSSDAENTRS